MLKIPLFVDISLNPTAYNKCSVGFFSLIQMFPNAAIVVFLSAETGKIIPAMYGTWRKDKKYSPYADIRRNLFFHYSSNQIVTRPP